MLPLHHRAVFGGEPQNSSPPKSKEDEQARTYGNPGGAAYGSRTRANSLEGCDASSTPMLHMAEAAGFEPANRRVKVCCLYRLTTLLYEGRAVLSPSHRSRRFSVTQVRHPLARAYFPTVRTSTGLHLTE